MTEAAKNGLDNQKKVCYTTWVKTMTERVSKQMPQREPLAGVKRWAGFAEVHSRVAHRKATKSAQ